MGHSKKKSRFPFRIESYFIVFPLLWTALFILFIHFNIVKGFAGYGLVWGMGVGILIFAMTYLKLKLHRTHDQETSAFMDSEARNRRLFNDSAIAILIMDTGTRFLDANPAGLDLLGYTQDELSGLGIGDVSVDPAATEQAGRQLMAGQRIINREHRLKKKNGEIVTVLNNAIPITDRDDQVIGIHSSFIDITRRKQAEQQLKINESFLSTLLEAVPIPLFFKDNDGRYLGVNKAFERLYGYERSRLIGKTVFETHPKAQAEVYFKKDKDVLKSGGCLEYEATLVNSQGIPKNVVIHKAVYNDSFGHKAGVIGTVRDVTESLRNDRIRSVRMRLSEFSLTNTVSDLLKRFLDEAERLTNSDISFFHFVEPDQQTLSLQMWSTNTLENMCDIDLSSLSNTRYSIDEAGVWIDCIRDRKPVIHNDYGKIAHRKGLPQGHAPVVRELVIPVFRGDKIVAVLGVGNKDCNYNADDVKTVSDIADMAWDIVLRKQTEEALKDSEEKYRTMMEVMVDPVYICSDQYQIKYMNHAMVKWLGEDLTGQKCYSSIYNFTSPCTWCPIDNIRELKSANFNVVNPRDNRHYNVSSSPIVNADGSIFKLAIFRDITETMNLEKQLRQVQKLEAIGTLAGGIAHDFNNILFAIMGYAEISLASVDQNQSVNNDIREILKAAHRAKDLVHQILTFSRETEQEMRPIKIRFIIKEVLKLIKASIPATIEIKSDITSQSKIMGDPTQIHQVIMNLCTNSAHAMEAKGGCLTVELHDIFADEALTSKFVKMQIGHYIHLRVLDTGHGIKKIDLERIFEPFYTTKPDGKGTGLGLSLVHGILKNHRGQIAVDSVPGQGACFDVYLPVLDSGAQSFEPETTAVELPRGRERILIVDDEQSIVKILDRCLSRYGYAISGTSDPERAVELFKTAPQDYDMVITDMTMPKMTGDVLAEAVLAIRPDVPVILITGFSDRLDRERRPPGEIKKVLIKPVIKSDLLHTVRQVFDELAP